MDQSDAKTRAGEIPEIKYEYLDHTADVQLHSWGRDLNESFEQVAMAMFGYMTELDKVEILEKHQIEAESDDLEGLLFRFLDELLYLFSAEPYIICKKVVITEMDLDNYKIKCDCYGESFDLKKHPQGTEVKAITYSAMQIIEKPDNNRVDIFVIIDI